MMNWFKRYKNFDPRSADPFVCWAVMEMEREGYLQICRGKVTVTDKGQLVSPAPILRQQPPLWECNLSKAVLILEQEGLLTVRGGNLALTAAGQQAYAAIGQADSGHRTLGSLSEVLKATKDFDPRHTGLDVCWGLLVLEEHGYISIKRGFVVGGELEEFHLPRLLEEECSDADCSLGRLVLILEAMGLATIQRGVCRLSDAGMKKYAEVTPGRCDKSASGNSSGNDDRKTIKVGKRMHSFIERCALDGESANDVIRRLLVLANESAHDETTRPE